MHGVMILSFNRLAVALGLLAFAGRAAAQDIRVSNSSAYVGGGRWDWTIHINAPPDVLDRIACVEYTLHPTFPKPVRRVCAIGDKENPFALSANGWGTFNIRLRVIFKNGEERHLSHELAFEMQPVQPATIALRPANVAQQIAPGLYRWTVFLQGAPDALGLVQCVEYTLHPTFPNPVQEVCKRGDGPQAFALTATGWGTFRIGIRVRMKDGRVQEMSHDLRF